MKTIKILEIIEIHNNNKIKKSEIDKNKPKPKVKVKTIKKVNRNQRIEFDKYSLYFIFL